MDTEYDDNVSDCRRLPNNIYIVNFKKDDGFKGENDAKNTLPNNLRAVFE